MVKVVSVGGDSSQQQTILNSNEPMKITLLSRCYALPRGECHFYHKDVEYLVKTVFRKKYNDLTEYIDQ